MTTTARASGLPGLPSPCINVCKMDEVTGWCAGCLRTIDEIALWSQLGDDDKREVWAALDARREEWRRLRPDALPALNP